MKAYQPATPHAALGAAALLLTAGTLLLAVVIPAGMNFRSHEIPVFTLSNAIEPRLPTRNAAPIDSVDVVAIRGSRWITVVESGSVQARPRLQG